MAEGVLAGTRAHWRSEGTGPHNMLLLHCTLGHSGAWKGVMAHLGDGFSMKAMDLPGHGRSGPLSSDLTWQTQSTRMAIELLEAGHSPCHLVGHSFGATVALRLAVERPDLVLSLTLIEPVFFSAAKDAGSAEFETHIRAHDDFMALLDAQDHARAARAFSQFWEGANAWEAMAQSQRDYMAARIEMIRAGGASLVGQGPDYIPLSRISGFPRPVLLIEGDRTDPIITVVQKVLSDTFKRSRRVTIKGAGHMVPITHPADVAREIRAYLKL